MPRYGLKNSVDSFSLSSLRTVNVQYEKCLPLGMRTFEHFSLFKSSINKFYLYKFNVNKDKFLKLIINIYCNDD